MDHPPALGRILDPQALEDEEGARARLRITVPSAWLDEACELELVVPLRLPCARCDGGGCDGCGRSGAIKAPGGEAERTLSTRLPPVEATGVALRISRPFGPEAEIAQLFLEVRAGDAPSLGVRRVVAPAPLALVAPAPLLRRPAAIAFTFAALVAALAALLAGLFGR